MERILLRNGIPEPMPRIEGTYLYQTLHVRGRRPLWLDRHTELLARNIQELFGLRWAPDLRRLEAEIAALLDANRHPVAGSSFVRMAFTPAGDQDVANDSSRGPFTSALRPMRLLPLSSRPEVATAMVVSRY